MHKLLNTLKLSLLHLDYVSLDTKWNYNNVISPFSRIYYITEGKAYTEHHGKTFELLPDRMYLVPAFTKSRYYCEGTMSQYYIHILDNISGNTGIFDLIDFNYEVEATPLDKALFERLSQINPNKSLFASDPKDYDNSPFLLSYNQSPQNSYANYTETKGILLQLFSRFMKSTEATNKRSQSWRRLSSVMHFINENLSEKITVEELANMVHLNADYFSRLFLELKGERPIDFINNKRMEKAQLLLDTTDQNISEIAHQTGFQSLTYFSRTFKKRFGISPVQYRKSGWKKHLS